MIWLSIDPSEYGIYNSETDQVIPMDEFFKASLDVEMPEDFVRCYANDLRELADKLEAMAHDTH